MAAPKGIDWLSARKDYIENRKLSYSDISKKYGVSRTVVGQRAKAEAWTMSRKSIDNKVILKVEGEIVDRNFEINKRHGVAFKNMQQLANAKLTIAYRQVERLINEKGIDNLSIYDSKMISQRDLKDLSEALTTAINGERVTLGLPTSVERKQVSSRDKKELFIDDNYQDYVKLLADSLVALEEKA